MWIAWALLINRCIFVIFYNLFRLWHFLDPADRFNILAFLYAPYMIYKTVVKALDDSKERVLIAKLFIANEIIFYLLLVMLFFLAKYF